MIFPLPLVLIVIGAILLWSVLYIAVTKSGESATEFGVLSIDRHSVTEHFFNKAERRAERLVFNAHGFAAHFLLKLLTVVAPVVRILSEKMLRGINNMIRALGGTHDLPGRRKASTSEFLADIREHAEESRKTGGAIHE
jgi:hypothetical protein